MPGIVGLITRLPRERAVPELLRMVEALRHEPFYEVGTWIDESLGVYVAWTVRKPSLAHAPTLGEVRDETVLVFSGEAVADGGIIGVGASPLPGREADHLAFLASLNGRFHGLLADRR